MGLDAHALLMELHAQLNRCGTAQCAGARLVGQTENRDDRLFDRSDQLLHAIVDPALVLLITGHDAPKERRRKRVVLAEIHEEADIASQRAAGEGGTWREVS